MRIDEAADILKSMYESAHGKALSVHLFGIKYADEIRGLPLKELARYAGLPESYHTEIRKGINIAPHVILKN